jgi:hypothetical protein
MDEPENPWGVKRRFIVEIEVARVEQGGINSAQEVL